MRKWLIIILIILVFPFTSYSDVAGPFNLTVKQANGVPTLSHIKTLVFDQVDGLSVQNLGNGIARLKMTITDAVVPDDITAINYCNLSGGSLCNMIGNLQLSNQNEVRFYEATGNGSNYQSLSAPASLATNTNLILNITPSVCVADPNGGKLTVNSSNELVCSTDNGGAGGGNITVKESDNTPSVANVTSIAVNNTHMSVTDNGSGAVTMDIVSVPWASLTGVPSFRKTLFVFKPQSGEPAATGSAVMDTVNAHPVVKYVSTSSTCYNWTFEIPTWYGGNGITLYITWASVPTTGNEKWDFKFERVNTALGTDSFAAAQTTGAVAVSGTTELPLVSTIAFTDGAQIDGVLAGEAFRLQGCRDTTVASNASGDGQIVAIRGEETP